MRQDVAKQMKKSLALNNEKKFVNFLIDTHYHDRNKQMRTEIDTRKLCLKNKYIGPKQLKVILSILSQNA